MKLLPSSFFTSNAIEVAQKLLGQTLCRLTADGQLKKGIIVETEAYMPDDPACHAFRGPTKRSSVMFCGGGISYVYFIYGMYYCLNVVTGKAGSGQAVLIRALQTAEENPLLAAGPGKLCRYLEITTAHNGLLLVPESGLWIEKSQHKKSFMIETSKRIGIRQGKEKEWRFFIQGNPAVSGQKRRF